MSISEVTSAKHIFRSGSDWPYRGISERPVVQSIIAAVAARGSEFSKHIARRVRINADRHRLKEMPDHVLKDIGIGRPEIDYRVEYGRAEDEVRMLGLR